MTRFKKIYIKQGQTQMIHIERNNCRDSARYGLIIALITSCLGLSGCAEWAKHSKQVGFVSDEAAVNAFVKAVRENDNEELLNILGPDGKDLIWSGDKVGDQQGLEMFVKAYDEQHRIYKEGDKKILAIGKEDWPFPIPIVEENGKWIFDTSSGKEEILNRRIGRNELEAIQVMLAVVDAEREYATKDRDGDGILEYALKFRSDLRKKNGLYWETKNGEEQSPLGPLVAEAREEGYFEKTSSDKPLPYHGYFYRILKAQGNHAEGGAYDYIVKGKMIGGFAVAAYPAEYGNSGVMTFIVNHDEVVYQKDLGSNTERKAKTMKRFDPDKTWKKVE